MMLPMLHLDLDRGGCGCSRLHPRGMQIGFVFLKSFLLHTGMLSERFTCAFTHVGVSLLLVYHDFIWYYFIILSLLLPRQASASKKWIEKLNLLLL